MCVCVCVCGVCVCVCMCVCVCVSQSTEEEALLFLLTFYCGQYCSHSSLSVRSWSNEHGSILSSC